MIIPTDVSKLEEVVRLKDKVYDTWGEVRITTRVPDAVIDSTCSHLSCMLDVHPLPISPLPRTCR